MIEARLYLVPLGFVPSRMPSPFLPGIPGTSLCPRLLDLVLMSHYFNLDCSCPSLSQFSCLSLCLG